MAAAQRSLPKRLRLPTRWIPRSNTLQALPRIPANLDVMDYRTVFSERLRALRSARGLTQKDVYDAIDMSSTGYIRYELGMREPAFRYLIALADFYDVSLDYLVGRSDDPRRL